jgi:hypothetical protein
MRWSEAYAHALRHRDTLDTVDTLGGIAPTRGQCVNSVKCVMGAGDGDGGTNGSLAVPLTGPDDLAEREAIADEPEPDRTPLPPPANALVERLAAATGRSLDEARHRLDRLAPLARGLLVGAAEAAAGRRG